MLPVPDPYQLQACLVGNTCVPRAAAVGGSGQWGREPGREMAQGLTLSDLVQPFHSSVRQTMYSYSNRSVLPRMVTGTGELSLSLFSNHYILQNHCWYYREPAKQPLSE